MTLKRKLGIAAVLVAALTITLWPRPRGYTYQGKTVEEWFRDYTPFRYGIPDNGAENAFREMGTNGVPFLVSRINRDFAPSLFERWAYKLPLRFRPVSKDVEAFKAAALLGTYVNAHENMLRELLKPAILSTNQAQRNFADRALNGSLFRGAIPMQSTSPPAQ